MKQQPSRQWSSLLAELLHVLLRGPLLDFPPPDLALLDFPPPELTLPDLCVFQTRV